MPLYRIHYQRHGRDHDMTFAATDDEAADAYARSVLAKIVEAPIERIEPMNARPYRRQRNFWETTE